MKDLGRDLTPVDKADPSTGSDQIPYAGWKLEDGTFILVYRYGQEIRSVHYPVPWEEVASWNITWIPDVPY